MTSTTTRPLSPQWKSDEEIVRDLKFLNPGVENPAKVPSPALLDKARYAEAWTRFNKPIEPYSDFEHSVGVKNFRREYLGIVHSLSSYNPINPAVERLDDPATYNVRFAKLAQGMKAVYAACGDVAIRDRRFAESFFTGYANPLISFNHIISNKNDHEHVVTFSTNGKVIENPDGKLVFNIDSLSTLELENVYIWTFVNGLLIDKSDYEVVNTAFGVKLFLKPTNINDGDEISVVVNRKFNTSKNLIKHEITSNVNSLIKVFKGSALGDFYHHKYVKVYLKRTSLPTIRPVSLDEEKLKSGERFKTLSKESLVYKTASSFIELPKDYYTLETDNSGQNVKLSIRNFELEQGDVLYIMNSVNYFEHHETINVIGGEMVTEFPLVENFNGDIRPIAYGSIEDFDVFFDGYHLTAGKHYTIVRGGNSISPFKLKLLMTPKAQAQHKISIYKNESVIDDDDYGLIRKATLPEKGLVTATNNYSMPLMPRLGHCFSGGLYQANKTLKFKFRRLMQIEGFNVQLNTNPNLEYRCRIVNTLDTQHVVRVLTDHITEFDLIGEIIGLPTIIENLGGRLGDNVELRNNVKKAFEEEVKDTITITGLSDNAIALIRSFIKYYHDNNLSRPLILDSNVMLTDANVPMNLIGNVTILDSNSKQSKALILDSNYLFSNPFANPMR